MAPRSPTHAFDPTPALEHNRTNFSPLNHPVDMISVESHFPHASKEVRFSDSPANPFTRAHSIATEGVPLLPQISSASRIPRQAFRITNPTPGIDINAYIENCRNLNEQLRVAHDSERKAWEIERNGLKAKIADLEFRLNQTRGNSARRISKDSPPRVLRSPPAAAAYGVEKVTQEPAPANSLSAPIWKGPENHPPTARVFPTDDSEANHLSNIAAETHLAPLSKEISPTNAVSVESVPIPIEQVEPTLDGITLKSAALTSSFVTKITSPQFGSPALSPSQRPRGDPSILHIDANALLAPLDEKLKRHAGHTPMNFDAAFASNDTSDRPSVQLTPQAEKPFAPAPTTRPPLRPTENSDSYFSTTSVVGVNGASSKPEPILEEDHPSPLLEPEDDEALKGPLMLDPNARSEAADAFLSSVDAKLMAAVREISPKRRESILSETAEPVTLPIAAERAVVQSTETAPQGKRKEQDDDMPSLRLKKSMNFGSAYGASLPGRW